MKKLGLIINPVAGLGGRVGLKGSDGPDIQRQALALGAVPEAFNRTTQALTRLQPLKNDIEIITYPGEMGAEAALACGFAPTVIGAITAGATTPADTEQAAREMAQLSVSLLLFAGGDGTARNIYHAVGADLPALGIPAGVKIHSAVYAANPGSAGELAGLYLQGRVTRLREAEVMDLDEAAVRQGIVSARLYGYLNIPFQPHLVQSLKSASPPGEQAAARAIAWAVVEQMSDEWLYLVGPGTTTRAITDHLGLSKTLIGVDVIFQKKLLLADANEAQLRQLLAEGRPAKIIVTPIGGQGYILGRGNQQFSPAIIRQVGRENLLVVSAPGKIHALHGRPLQVDTGDPALDTLLKGHIRVITGYNEHIIYRLSV